MLHVVPTFHVEQWDGPKYEGYPQHVKHIGSLSKDQVANMMIHFCLL